MHSVYDFTEKGVDGGIHFHLGEERTDDINEILYGDKNISLTGTNAKLPSGSKTVGDIMNNLGTLAFADNISIPLASSEQAGVVVLSSETTNTNDETKAATIKAVGDVNNSAVHKTGDEHITGTKNFSDGIIVGGNLKITTKTDESGNTTVDFAEVNA